MSQQTFIQTDFERCLRWSLSFAVPLPCGTLREHGSKLARASRREVRATPTLDIEQFPV